MTTITTRAANGAPLSHAQMDANFTGLNAAKAEWSADGLTLYKRDSTNPAIIFDANGNIIANVTHRTGTLANLKLIPGGNGEISKPTDFKRTLLLHNGVASGQRTLRDGGLVAIFASYVAAFGTAGMADTALSYSASWRTDDIVAAGSAITIPAGAIAYEVNIQAEFMGAAEDGAKLLHYLDTSLDGVTFTNNGHASVDPLPQATGLFSGAGTWAQIRFMGNIGIATHLKLRWKHTNSQNILILHNIVIKFYGE